MIKSAFRSMRDLAFEVLPARSAIQLEFLFYHRRLPRLNPPITFSEKIVYRKLVDRDPRMPRLSDKILAKEFVTSTLGKEWIIPSLWFGDKLPPRSERNWPLPFVLKASHGSGWNYFAQAEEDLRWDRIEELSETWLRSTFATRAKEWLYTQIEPRLLVEPFEGTGGVAPIDYKFHLFDGRTAFIQVDLGRLQTHRQLFYDAQWNRLPYWYLCPYDPGEAEPPRSLAEMTRAAELLGKHFSYVRVDLYEINGTPKFGELTFYPNSGQVSFKPERVEYELGRLWTG